MDSTEIKVHGHGGRLIQRARYCWLLLAKSHLTRRLFAGMLRKIAMLRPAGSRALKAEQISMTTPGMQGEVSPESMEKRRRQLPGARQT